ncbi:DUF4876 domain-containing protein [Pedobacter sp.]|uniref:DUF4876 domain-containing protein n=1 Tax=Pedobacter sp. TaxID=1411316 RepID=UPI00396C64A2
MKKLYFLIATLLFIFTACKRNAFEDLKPVALNVNVSFDQSLREYALPLANAEIKLTNLANGLVTTIKSDADGKASIDKISPGNYDIEATLTIKAADYTTYVGIFTENDVVFNGLLKSQNIIQNVNSLSLALNTGKIGDWVFKQIYYAGSHTSNGASFRDQFIEIYNNSNQVLYADSLYFVQAYGTNSKLSAIDLTTGYYQVATKQYDWTKSIDMNDPDANNNYVYAKNIFMIPGSGKDHPVKPGESIIIAGTALNHKTPYVGNDGKGISVKDPSLTIDLSKADFEVYLGNYPGITPLASDIDNPAVPNMVNIDIRANKDLILDATGREALLLFKTTRDIQSWKRYAAPDIKVITTSTDKYYQIPLNEIFDAVEIQPPLEANQIPKKFNAKLDATFKFVSKGQYSSQSLIRKTAKVVNGRQILKDTNSSANDFDELNIPDVTKSVFK